MKILVGIPVLFGYKHTMDAFNSVLNQSDVDLLIIDNGSAEDIKELIKLYIDNPKVKVIVNEKNIYVNPAWNQIMQYFLDNREYDLLCIMNSDLTMQNRWSDALRYLYDMNEFCSYLPLVVSDCVKIERMANMDIKGGELNELKGGVAGIFITLTRDQCKLVYPIPSELIVWFGDNWIYDTLRAMGDQTFSYSKLIAFHGLSQNVSRVEGIGQIIEEDKIAWYDVVSKRIQKIQK